MVKMENLSRVLHRPLLSSKQKCTRIFFTNLLRQEKLGRLQTLVIKLLTKIKYFRSIMGRCWNLLNFILLKLKRRRCFTDFSLTLNENIFQTKKKKLFLCQHIIFSPKSVGYVGRVEDLPDILWRILMLPYWT